MNTPQEKQNYAAVFIRRLEGIRDDRGKMAALRRGLSPGTARESWPIIASLGQDIARIAPCTVAALYAAHPEHDAGSHSLGTTCREIATDKGREREIVESFQRRFRRLLACDSAEDVAGQLQAWIRFASARSVKVNYEQLYWDLAKWELRADETKLRWARDFWPPHRDGEEATPVEVAA